MNVEGWNRFALSFLKIDRIPSFDVRRSMLDVRRSLVSISINLAVFLVGGGARMKLHVRVYVKLS